jgi:predicted phosphodiesterase
LQKITLVFLFLLVSCASRVEEPSRSVASADRNWGFLVLSDIHVFTSIRPNRGIVPKNFSLLVEELVSYVEENNIKFIILLGDSTGGNKDDNRSLATVKMWWDELIGALNPLTERGVRIFPVAGNHDFYTDNHQKGYEYAWSSWVNKSNQQFKIDAPNSLYYKLTYGSFDLFLLHAVDYNLGKEQEHWLSEVSQASKDNGQLKMAMGHVALYTRLIRRPFASFGDKIRNILTEGNIKHYLAGHEHYFWDEYLGPEKMRQTIMGTSSGTYNFSPNIEHYSKYCKNSVCKLEPDGNSFAVNASDRRQIHTQMFLHFEVDEDVKDYKLKPMAFQKGKIIPFTLP